MKKFAMMLAAGVVAFGVSAQAASVESSTYAVVTVPVAAGYNFIGVSVAPLSGTAGTYADLLSVADDTPVSVYDGSSSGYTGSYAGDEDAVLGSAILYNNAGSATTIYEVGVAQTATTSVDLVGDYTLVATPYADAWSPASTSLNQGSYKRYGDKVNKIHVWNGTGWTTLWYKDSTTDGGWKVYGDANATVPTIGAAQAVLVQKGAVNTATSVTFTAP